jgi:hypothetical protein
VEYLPFPLQQMIIDCEHDLNAGCLQFSFVSGATFSIPNLPKRYALMTGGQLYLSKHFECRQVIKKLKTNYHLRENTLSVHYNEQSICGVEKFELHLRYEKDSLVGFEDDNLHRVDYAKHLN